ncbi:toll-like receptor 3 [Lytechinus pictus]|uniref:toll-like receptor 3 n=1 Tax=Lytechinus pictus TaxID=7653 RepID=UPI0030B9B9D7
MATVIDFQTVSFSQQQRGMQRLEANLETLVNVEKQCTIDLVIKKVYCPHRNLTEVPDDLLMDVEILDLQSNRIHTLVNTSFTRYTNLIILNLSGNNICYIEPATFATLTHLQDLDLSYNQGIQLRNPGGIPWSWNLTRITLANCNIKRLPTDFMEWFPKLRDVSFLNNDISNVNVTCSPFRAERITKMSFCGNQIHELIPETFRLDCDVDYLDLLRNGIIRISPHVISLLRVKSLSFGWFRLTSRSWINLFTGIAQSGIRQLSMLNTPLDITLDLFNPLHNYPLFKLHLSHIYLQRINHSAFSNLTQNQLDCNCKIAWLLDWLQSSSNLKLVAESKTICSMASLENLGGKPLLTFDPKHYCGPDIGLLCSLPLALVGLFAMMFAIHRYRWLFSYKLFLLKLAVVGYQEVVDARHHGDFEYDLNIMFLEDDEQWVQEHLRPVLEERLPNFNRIVFGDEDLVIGMHYFDAVFHAVEKSFKTVLLFSRAAFQDNWFMIKFRVAFEQVNDARMENIVVIFIEDIPDAELPYLVRLYLSERRTYLWWVEDERHQEYFWNELILTLQSDNMRWNNMIPLE